MSKTTETNQEALAKLPPQAYFDEQEALAKLVPIADQLVALVQTAPQCLYQIQEPAVNQQLTTEQQPVAGQCRFKEREWGACHPKHVAMVLFSPHEWPDYEVRYLYAAPVLAAQPDSLQALRALHDSVELAMQRGALSERALEIIILQPATDVLMRSAVIVPDHIHSTEANSLYGESYGVDWVYEGKKAVQPQVLAAIFAARGALQHLKEGGKPTEALINDALQAIESIASPQEAPAAVAVPDERAAFDDFFRKRNGLHPDTDTTFRGDAAEPWKYWQARAALAATPAADAPLPLLVRDIARELGITCAEACLALKPLGNFSTNTAVTAEMMAKLRECFPERIPASEVAGARERMTAGRACYFMERFLKEEKLLDPNEQAALHYVIDMLEAAAAPVVLPEPFALYDGEKWYANEEAAICSCANMQKLQKVYTEQQVRALLATGNNHSVESCSTPQAQADASPVPTPCRSMFATQREYADAMEQHRKNWAELESERAQQARDAERYRGVRLMMQFEKSGKTGKTVMTFNAPLDADATHDIHEDWMAAKFDASVDRTIDAAIAAAKGKDQ